jgi:hypothetical protein
MTTTAFGKRITLTAFGIVISVTLCLSSACTNAGPNSTASLSSNANAAANINANTNAAAPPASSAVLAAKEPESYSVTTTITVTPTGKAPQTSVPPLQFSFAKMSTARRVSFKLPDPVGEVIYLEQPSLKYLIFPARNQYVELDPVELGFQLGALMSPVAIIDRLKQRSSFEVMDTETVNGRTAVKYRFRGATDTHTKAGTAQADSLVYVDQETGLPLRSEIETTSTSGLGARIVTTAEGLQLNPASSLFEPPTTMKKVTSAELKQQVQGFVNTLRIVAGYLKQQLNPAAQAGAQP